jgi:lipoprotein signal peptidase
MTATTEEPDAEPRHLFRGKAWFWIPVPLWVAFDLWSKWAAFEYVGRDTRTVPFDFLPEPLGFTWGLMVLRCVALGVLLWFVAGAGRAQRFQQFVLGLIFSGAIGNLYDNFFMPDRGVRDFLYFYVGEERNPVYAYPAFNVADSCITVGALFLLVLLWREPKPQVAEAAS